MDNGHGFRLCHHGGVQIVLNHALGLQRFVAPYVQLRGSPPLQPQLRRRRGARRGLLLRLLPRLLLQQAHLSGLGRHFHLARLQNKAAVAADLQHRGGGAYPRQLHQISRRDRAGGSRRLRCFLPQVQGVLSGVEMLPRGHLGVVDGLKVRLLLHFFAQLVQLGENLVHLLLRLPHDAFGLVFALAAGVFLGLFHLFAEAPRFAGVLLALLPEAVGLVLRLLQPLPLFLQLGQHVLKAHGLAVHLLLGRLNHRLVQPQPP